jgi:predicted permease
MHALLQDVRYAFRLLRRSPGFTLTAVITLALGSAATTAMFSVFNQGLLHPLPYPNSSQLVKLNWVSPAYQNWDVLNSMQALFFTEHSHTLQSAGVTFASPGCNLAAGGKPEYVHQGAVSTGFFPTLGINPMLGRNFAAEDIDSTGTPRVAILTYKLWKDHFAGDEKILGRNIQCNGLSYSVIGVLPKEFSFAEDPADIWVPDSLSNHQRDTGANYFTIARLKDGVSIENGRQELKALAPEFRRQFPKYIYSPRVEYPDLIPYSEARSGESRESILFLFGAVVLLMLIACANVAGLMLVRANGRSREIAVRVAIGASQARILRQLLTESFLLNIAGGTAGLVLLGWLFAPLNAIVVRQFPAITELKFDSSVLAFSVVASLMTALLSGLAPALQASRPNLALAMKSQTNSSDSKTQQRTRKLLVIGEVALAVMLMVGATLLLRSFLMLRSVSPGFRPQNLQVAQMYLSSERYQSTAQVDNFLREVQVRGRQIPGVVTVGAISGVPTQRGLYLNMAGGKCSDGGAIQYRPISTDYLKTIGIPIIAGRDLQEHESAPVALVNEALARDCWPGKSAVYEELTVNPHGAEMRESPRQIVGVVGDTRDFGLYTAPRPTVYVPVGQTPDPINKYQNGIFRWAIVVRTQNTQDVSRLLEQAVLAADPQQSVITINKMEELFGELLASSRMMVQLTSFFTGTALLLTAIGLYGLLSYSILQRTRELGIRIALGAARNDVVKMIVREGIALVSVGTVAGMAAALAGNRVMASLLYRLKPLDPVSFGVAVAVLLAVALLASCLPAIRATRIDPILALRQE